MQWKQHEATVETMETTMGKCGRMETTVEKKRTQYEENMEQLWTKVDEDTHGNTRNTQEDGNTR